MKLAVRYYTRSGNTKKLADAIAKAICTDAKAISEGMKESVDILFLGCSYYAFDMDESVKSFLADHKDKIGKIVCFGTSAMMKSMKKPLTRVASSLGIAIAEEEFHCRGQFYKVHPGRPNEKDLEEISSFAKKIVAEL